jgi:hypothetical protein
LRRVHASLLPWKSNKYYIFVCVCVCARALVALLIQHATRMRHIVTLFVAPLAPPHFSKLFHKRHGFREKDIEYKMCLFIFSITFVWNISHSKNLARYCQKYENIHVKYLLFLSDFHETWILSTAFKTSLKHQIWSKSVQWEPSCSMRKDRETDGHDEANSRFSQFCERHWKLYFT